MAPSFIKLFGVDIDVSMKGDADIELRLRLEPPCCCVYNPQREFRPPNQKRNKSKKKKKRERGESSSVPKRRRVAAEVQQEPDHSIPPELLERVEYREPVFLYQKKLTESDADKTLSRLFVLKREGFETMLTEAEWGTVTGEKLKNIVSVDTGGRLYKLGLTIWPSLDMLVINSQWSKLIKQNNAKEDDWVQIWGHRDHVGKFCMALNFYKP